MQQRLWTSFLNNVVNWGKLIFPQKYLRFYPPMFVIRNPVAEGVHSSFKKGYQVAVITFNFSNINELTEQLGSKHIERYKRKIKRYFKAVVQDSILIADIVTLHDFYSDGLALFIRVNHEKQNISEIEVLITDIVSKVKEHLNEEYPHIQSRFETGYMFVEKKSYSLDSAIYNAQQQAIAMAEKRIQSQFNDLVYKMNKIIEERDIKLMAQPIIDVSSKEIKAWEMLTRGPRGTILESPLQLFSVARQTNMLYDLEMIVLEKAFTQIIKTGCQHLVFINFTPTTLGNPRFLRTVKKLLLKFAEIIPYNVIIEVTERDSIDGVEYFSSNIKSLRKLGFRIAVDDTGAGYASLHTISEIMPDIIKIDRSVIQDIDTNTVKESMLKGLLLIAKETGSLVVAEGIEKQEEATVLSRNHVDLAQGYFYAKPGVLLEQKISS